MKVLGIETSCDETAIAVVENGELILSHVVASSLEFHRKYGGIIPEIASRYHVEVITALLEEALIKAGIDITKIDLVAVTQGPGLIGSLLVGISFAKAIALGLKKPLIGVDHILAHSYAVWFQNRINFPYFALTVSGGHSCLILMEDFDKYQIIADTRDDAIGEAFDKVARLLGLAFPGGPEIERLARYGKPGAVKLPLPEVKGSYDFSFSGLKTAMLYWLRKKGNITEQERNDACYEFQEKAFDSLILQIKKAMQDFAIKRLVLGGGVAINKRLREKFNAEFDASFELYFSPPELCGDNATIVAGLAYRLYNKGKRDNLNLKPYTIFGMRR